MEKILIIINTILTTLDLPELKVTTATVTTLTGPYSKQPYLLYTISAFGKTYESRYFNSKALAKVLQDNTVAETSDNYTTITATYDNKTVEVLVDDWKIVNKRVFSTINLDV